MQFRKYMVNNWNRHRLWKNSPMPFPYKMGGQHEINNVIRSYHKLCQMITQIYHEGWDLSFLLPVTEEVLLFSMTGESKLWTLPANFCASSRSPFPEVSTPLETVATTSSAVASVMQSQGFEDSSLESSAKGTCHDPFSDSWNTIFSRTSFKNSFQNKKFRLL